MHRPAAFLQWSFAHSRTVLMACQVACPTADLASPPRVHKTERSGSEEQLEARRRLQGRARACERVYMRTEVPGGAAAGGGVVRAVCVRPFPRARGPCCDSSAPVRGPPHSRSNKTVQHTVLERMLCEHQMNAANLPCSNAANIQCSVSS